MSEIKRKTEENIEDVKRISNILNRRIKKSNIKLGPPGKTKNPFLLPSGGFDLIEIFPSYESKKKRKAKR
ncbi:hypothetical protein ES695_01650 [Candidatus Atribacteria bacterium 1244-E10-H5-B2]|nr:MAG: hypothetical protein ES695_01650 [Candidatus Atribacteria bacterium 1244-E10-H5-B2]